MSCSLYFSKLRTDPIPSVPFHPLRPRPILTSPSCSFLISPFVKGTLTIVVAVLFLIPSVQAEVIYSTNVDRTLLITGYNGPGGSVAIPEVVNGRTVTGIANQSLRSWTALTTISIPRTITFIGTQALTDCSQLLAINVDPLNPVYSSLDGVLFDKSRTLLIQYPGGKPGTYRIPESTATLQVGCCALSVGLTGLIVPKSITNLTSFTCYTCANLMAVYFMGNPPSAGSGALDFTPATVYYLPGTTGWGPTFYGHPTVLWNPEISAIDSNVGLNGVQFGFNITGTSNLTIVVEACSDLANPIWTPVSTNTLLGGPFHFADPQSTNHSMRFYRLRSP